LKGNNHERIEKGISNVGRATIDAQGQSDTRQHAQGGGQWVCYGVSERANTDKKDKKIMLYLIAVILYILRTQD